MKKIIIATFLAAWIATPMWAKNIVTTVTQVTEAVTLDTDVDYHISSDTPFAEGGSINITNTEHAVVIMEALKPSLAKAMLGYITINGNKAIDGSNCQLKLYARGSILLPYGGSTFRPLTVFDEANYGGESYDVFTEGHNGSGFMKNVPSAWDNRIRSFKLKRGYMVTFALKDDGKGYSRCFIAANEDLAVNLPNLMAGRISSYRLFKWYDSSKVGVSDMLDANALGTLNAQSSFTWGPGKNMLPDVECVPHRIDESWPTPGGVGSTNYSPHLKTNNEPRNESDHGTWTMEQILANWEAMMATGLRICTPSSWDGSDYWNATGFLSDFINEIDKRGWRVDIIDLHGYWGETAFTTNVNNWAQKFQRPVWITEWLWGASWSGGSGIFKEASSWDSPTAEDLQKNKTVVSRILNNLNSNDACERYFYWNGERNCSKILRDGALTPAGEYFASMKVTKPGYTGYGNYIPADPPTTAPENLSTILNTNSMAVRVSFNLTNGDLSDSIAIMRSSDGGKNYEVVKCYSFSEICNKTSLIYSDPVPGGGTFTYKVVDIDYKGRVNESETSNVVIGGSEKGLPDFQYGTITSTPGETVTLLYANPFEEYPVLIGGSTSYANTGTGSNARGMVNNYISSSKANGLYASANYRENLWLKDGAPVTASRAETTNFIVGKPANGTIGTLAYEMGFVPKVEGESGYVEGSISYDNAKTLSNRDEEVREVKFRQPFESTPVVMVTPITLNTASTQHLTMWRIWDVTPEGFKVQLLRQKSNEATNNNVFRVGYLAMEQGQTADGIGHIYTVSTQEVEFTTAYKDIEFEYEATNPRMMAQLQTDYQLTARETQTAAVLRLHNIKSNSMRVYMQIDNSHNAMFITSSRPAIETIGFINISDDPKYDPDGISEVTTQLQAPALQQVFDLSGRRVNGELLNKGLYIVNGKKVLVK